MPKPPASPPRSFTIRVPAEVYLEISDVAQANAQPINTTVNHLLRLGLGKDVDLNATLRTMVARMIAEENPNV